MTADPLDDAVRTIRERIRRLGISVVTNMAAGVGSGKLARDEVLAVGAEAQPRLTALLRELTPALAA